MGCRTLRHDPPFADRLRRLISPKDSGKRWIGAARAGTDSRAQTRIPPGYRTSIWLGRLRHPPGAQNRRDANNTWSPLHRAARRRRPALPGRCPGRQLAVLGRPGLSLCGRSRRGEECYDRRYSLAGDLLQSRPSCQPQRHGSREGPGADDQPAAHSGDTAGRGCRRDTGAWPQDSGARMEDALAGSLCRAEETYRRSHSARRWRQGDRTGGVREGADRSGRAGQPALQFFARFCGWNWCFRCVAPRDDDPRPAGGICDRPEQCRSGACAGDGDVRGYGGPHQCARQ